MAVRTTITQIIDLQSARNLGELTDSLLSAAQLVDPETAHFHILTTKGDRPGDTDHHSLEITGQRREGASR